MEDLAVFDEQHPARPAGGLDGVGDHQHSLPGPVDLGEDVHNLPGGAGVQSAGGLVGQNKLGLGDDGPGDGRALLLPAGDFVGELFQQLGNAQALGNGLQALAHLRILFSSQHQGQKDVVLHREGVQQVEVLEDKAQVVPAEGGNFPFLQADNVPHVEEDLTGGGLIQGGQNVEQGGFARAGLAHNGHKFPLFHREVHVMQGLHLGPAQAVGIGFL